MGRLKKYVRSCVNYFTIFKFYLYRNCVCLYWCFLYDLFWAIPFVDVWGIRPCRFLIAINILAKIKNKSGYRCTELMNVIWKSISIFPTALHFFQSCIKYIYKYRYDYKIFIFWMSIHIQYILLIIFNAFNKFSWR